MGISRIILLGSGLGASSLMLNSDLVLGAFFIVRVGAGGSCEGKKGIILNTYESGRLFNHCRRLEGRFGLGFTHTRTHRF